MERYVWDDFPVEITPEEMAKSMRLKGSMLNRMRDKLAEAKLVARPKAVFRVAYVDSNDGENVVIDGRPFQSEVLANNLEGLHRVFAYVITCGGEVDEWSHRQEDQILGLWLDMLKEMILRDTRNRFMERLRQSYHMEKSSSMSPGSGNADTWPLVQQRLLFDLIGDVEQDVGVKLTNSLLMLPTKSVSGFVFPSEKEFVNCALCARENCVGRQAVYTPTA